jgi:cell division protein FtsB
MNKEIKALKAENAEYSAQVERLKQEIEDLK